MAAKQTDSEQVVAIYKCLCDLKRLRILNLLRIEPQCVCHIEQVLGIGISGHRSKHMDEFLQQDVETVITVCGNADQASPMFPGQLNRRVILGGFGILSSGKSDNRPSSGGGCCGGSGCGC